MSKGILQLLKKSSVLMVARIIGGGLAFAVNIMIAKWFGADVLGYFALTMALASLLAVLLPAGMQSTAVLFVSQYVADGRLGPVRGYLRSGYWHMAIIFGVFAAILAASFTTLTSHFDKQSVEAATMALLIAPALALINFNCGALTGFKRQMLGLLPDLMLKPALIFGSVSVLGLMAGGSSLSAVLGVICGSIWLAAIGQFIAMRRAIRLSNHPCDKSEKKAWRKASLPWIPITLMWDYFIELHMLLAGLVLAPGKIGVLHICFRLRVLAAFGVKALSSLVMPDIYAAEAKGDEPRLLKALAKINFLTLGYALAVCAVMMVGGEFVLGLVDEQFRTGYHMLLAICASMIPRAVFGPTTAVLAMKGLQVPVVWIIALGASLSMIMCLALFPWLGVSAFAVAYVVSTTLISGLQWRWAKKKTGLDSSVFASMTVIREMFSQRAAANQTALSTDQAA